MRTKATNKKKKTKIRSVSYYKKIADKEMSLLVRSRGVCDGADISNCGGPLQDAHVISRTNTTLRYDILNHLSLCYRHHIHFWHTSPLEAMEWFSKKYPDRYLYLMQARNKITYVRTTEDYKTIIENIKSRNLNELVFDS